MVKGNTKNINIQVSMECWKRLKVMSIEKDKTLQEIVSDILEKFTAKKGKSEEG